MERPPWAPEGIDIDKPSPARIYDYHLGGRHNFPVDRDVAEQVARIAPEFPVILRANRDFLRRAVEFLVDAGIRQFLDLGSGIPTACNVHEIAQQAMPDARVVYVDVDPVAFAHSREILRGDPRAAAVHVDLRDVAGVLRSPEVGRLIDFSQPVGLLMVAVLHFIPDCDDLEGVLTSYRHALPGGSHLVISHGASDADLAPEGADEALDVYSRRVTEFTLRDKVAVTRMFSGWELVEPGVVLINEWHPDTDGPLRRIPQWAGVARLPMD